MKMMDDSPGEDNYPADLAGRDDLFVPGKLDFIYQFGHDTCCADIYFSDGSKDCLFHVSCILGDALNELQSSLAALLYREQGSAYAHWFDEPFELRWTLHRQHEMLDITIEYFRDYFYQKPDEVGQISFETTVDFHQFLQRIRLAASRVATMPRRGTRDAINYEETVAYQEITRYLKKANAS